MIVDNPEISFIAMPILILTKVASSASGTSKLGEHIN